MDLTPSPVVAGYLTATAGTDTIERGRDLDASAQGRITVSTARRHAAVLLVALAGLSASLVSCTRPPTTPPGGGQPGTKTVRYGPFTVPAAAPGRMGMLSNNLAFNVEKPCSDCYITRMQAGLVNPDGTTANVDQGLWLHHMVMFDSAKQDLTCPGTGVGLLGQRFFSSGNERTAVDGLDGYGYRIGANDSWTLIYDLMNMTAERKPVYITVSFDYIPATTPGIKELTPMWLDINQCGTSERPAKTGQYSYGYTWRATRPGRLLGIAGHIHDGGTHLTIEHNGQLVCDSKAGYGGPAYTEGPGSVDMPGMAHLSSMTICRGSAAQPVATIRTGDQIQLTAFYDSNAHMQMGDEPVMGIAVGYLDMN